MTNQPTIPVAVAHINSLVRRAVALALVPAPRHGWNDRALLNEAEAATLTFMPGLNLEFGEEFGCRVTLDVTPGHKRLGTPARVRIGTSGNQRSVGETAMMAKTLMGVASLACDIEAYLTGLDAQPLPEAVEAANKASAEREAVRAKAQAEQRGVEAAIRSERAKRGAETRKANAAFRR